LTIVYLLPIAAVILLLASRKATLLQAGIAGLLLTVPAAYLALPAPVHFPDFLAGTVGQGAWLAWQAIAVILGGLFFYNVVRAVNPALFAAEVQGQRTFSYREIFAVCFLLGPFFESATGFGVGLIITVPFLLRMGLEGPVAVVFALFSQILVPWGALAVGTVVGAGLAGVPLQEIGVYSALLSGPLLLGYLLVFWGYARRQGWQVSLRQRLDDVLWIGLLFALLYLANRYVAVQTGGLLATGLLLVLRFWRDMRPSAAVWRSVFRSALPYVLLTGIILATRTLSPLQSFMRGLWSIQPAPAWPVFPVFYHVSFWLLAVAIGYGLGARLTRSQWRSVGKTVWHAGRIPVVVTLTFVVMAQLMANAGIAAALAQSWSHVAGPVAVLASPVFAAVAGFLTGSNVASNAMLMPLQSALASHSGVSPGWVAALQNTAGSNFTLLSPVRVAMGAALLRIPGAEHRIYRLAFPLGLAAMAILVSLTAYR